METESEQFLKCNFSAQKLKEITSFLSYEMESIIDVGIFLEKKKIYWDEEELMLLSLHSEEVLLLFHPPNTSRVISQNQIAKSELPKQSFVL